MQFSEYLITFFIKFYHIVINSCLVDVNSSLTLSDQVSVRVTYVLRVATVILFITLSSDRIWISLRSLLLHSLHRYFSSSSRQYTLLPRIPKSVSRFPRSVTESPGRTRIFHFQLSALFTLTRVFYVHRLEMLCPVQNLGLGRLKNNVDVSQKW